MRVPRVAQRYLVRPQRLQPTAHARQVNHGKIDGVSRGVYSSPPKKKESENNSGSETSRDLLIDVRATVNAIENDKSIFAESVKRLSDGFCERQNRLESFSRETGKVVKKIWERLEKKHDSRRDDMMKLLEENASMMRTIITRTCVNSESLKSQAGDIMDMHKELASLSSLLYADHTWQVKPTDDQDRGQGTGTRRHLFVE